MSTRFQVTYSRTVLGSFATEIFSRMLYARTYKDAVRATQALPRFLELQSVVRLAPESDAEAAIRIARQDAGAVPHGC